MILALSNNVTRQFTVIQHQPEIREPCRPSPCGVNAVCRERNNAGSCSCLPGYFGDPYSECRPECVNNNDCSKRKSCVNNKCRDPCPGVCGSNTECHVANHSPYCSCLPGFTGNPSVACNIIRTFHCLQYLVYLPRPIEITIDEKSRGECGCPESSIKMPLKFNS